MTLIKLHFVESLRNLQYEIREKINLRTTAEPLPPNIQLSLFYLKFKTFASSTRQLISELEIRCPSHPEYAFLTRYYSLLKDCMNTYTSVRSSLMIPIITENIKAKNFDATTIQFTANGCAYMLNVCTDEYNLFKEFFADGEEEAKLFLENISSALSYTLRPLILKEHRIDVLSEMCTSLIFLLSSSNENNGQNSGCASFVFEAILHDAQSRLSFRAQDIIYSDIRQFKPREKELMVLARGPGLPIPNVVNSVLGVEEVLDSEISRRTSVAVPLNLEAAIENRSESLVLGFENSAVGGGEWYPTLQKTISLLTKLYGCLPAPSFDDLAQDAVESCRISIMTASQMLKAQQSTRDGQLFAIKNLMQLREHISIYDSNFTRSTRNFHFMDILGALKDVLVNPLVLQSYGSFLQVKEDDVRHVLDEDLKHSCEGFILETAKVCSNPILDYLKAVSCD